METRARKRARTDYNDDDEDVIERAAKRAKREKKAKQQVKTEIKKEIKNESANNHVKKEAKIERKSEVNKEAKIEAINAEKDKTIKPEQNNGIISRIVSYAKSFLFPDNELVEIEPDVQNQPLTTLLNNQIHNFSESISSSSSSESSESESEDESIEEPDVLFADTAKYNFDSFKTILLSRNKAQRWNKAAVQRNMALNSDIIAVIISISEFPQITIWTRVSKSTSNMVYAAQNYWKKLFREKDWRLPHEIRNKCFRFASQKPIPQLQISDDKVDWFSEFQRNYKTCTKIRKILRPNRYETDPNVAAQKKLKIAKWEKTNNYFMPNDMKEFYMCAANDGLLPPIGELQLFTTEMPPPFITMNDLYSTQPESDDEDEAEPIPDLESLSKLLDVPKSKLQEDVFGILYLDDSRSDCGIFVPYLNRMMKASIIMKIKVFLDVAVNLDLEPVKLDNLEIRKQTSQNIVDLFPEAPGVADAVENTIRLDQGRTLLHKNMMHYLTLAWYNHFSVVISPDMIFYTVLCELAEEIKKQPDSYRHLFTDSTHKKQILTTPTNGRIDLDKVVSVLSKNIAVDASLFTAEFSTTNNESRLAIQAAFCDAMSPYYYSALTKCGIPRIKVLGTKQDWRILEQKLYRMATEVFNNEIRSSEEDEDEFNRIVEYLNRAVKIIQRIQTDNTKEFWEKMYKIDKCRSGHTDFVKGWILDIYRNNYGGDFYNYKPHISLVLYKDLDSQKEYELRCGLLFSSIEQNTTDELDKKYPWLVPHFAHVVLDKSVKMTDEQYKNYINKALTGDQHELFTNFYDLIKDDRIMASDSETKQRLEIVGRQLDYWTAHPDSITEVDFSSKKFTSALSRSVSEQNMPESEIFLQKIKTMFDTCHIRSVNLEAQTLQQFEDRIIQFLIGNTHLEELTIYGYGVSKWINEDTDDEEKIFPPILALCELLSHPQCQLKSLKITGHPPNGATAALGKALTSMVRPIEKLWLEKVEDDEVADAIFELASNRGLKQLHCHGSYYCQSHTKVLSAIAASRTLEDTEIGTIGMEYPLDIFEELAKNLHQNTNLKSLKLVCQRVDYFDKELLNRLLNIPSLTKLDMDPLTTDFGFLSQTALLKHLRAIGNDSQLAQFLRSDTCQLQHLILKPHISFMNELGEALVMNKSLQKLDLNVSISRGVKKIEPISLAFGHSITTALKNQIPLRELRIEYYYHRIDAKILETILQAIIHHPFLERFIINSADIDEQGMENLIELVNTNKTIKEVYISGSFGKGDPLPTWTEAQQKRLIDALAQSETLTGFCLPRFSEKSYKQNHRPPYW